MFPSVPANAASTSPASPAAAATILAANGNRIGFSIYNSGTTVLYVLCDNSSSPPTVTSGRFTVSLPVSGYWECPWNFRGAVTAIAAASASGNIQVTEFSV